jgi:uncharacterized RDD family membrane protein YckC
MEKKFAGFWLRFLAWVIDVAIVYTALFLLGFILGLFLSVDSFNVFAERIEDSLVLDFLGIAIFWLYYAMMESSSKKATLGKMALNLEVLDVNGVKISFAKATVRHFSKIISGIILGIGFLMIAFDKKKQGLHDKIAGCIVTKK